MQSSRGSSLWRSLAVAFGDGLAFAVGMKLTQAASRHLGAPHPRAPRSDPAPLTDRIEQAEQDLKHFERVERPSVPGSVAVNQKVLEAIVNALEARLAEHAGQMERRLAAVEARLALELRSLDQQDHSIVKRVSDNIGALRQQMVGLHREFGESVARIVAEQVGSQVQARAAMLEESLHRQISAAVEAAVGAAVPAAIETRLPAAMNVSVSRLEQQLRTDVEHRDREIAELRQRLADTDTKVSELILGIGQICRQAAGKGAPPAVPPEWGNAHWQSQSPALNTIPSPTTGGAEEAAG